MKDKISIREEAWLKKHEKDFIRAELNLCKLLFIWETSKSKKKSKVVEQKEVLSDGSVKIKRITIESVGEKGTLLTVKKHFKTLLALIKLYEDAGRPEKVTFGVHQLAEILDLSWGRSTYRYLKEALEGLRKVPLTFENIFYNKQTGKTEEFIKIFNWLEDLEIYGRLKNKQPNFSISAYTFNKYIRQNILNNYTKPLFLNTITGFKTEIAILLYNHIDLVMADKNCYERNLKNLIEVDFKLDGNYPSPGHRKILFSKPIKELEGVKLTTGILTGIRLEKTKDGKDYKIVCRKSLPSLADVGKESEELAAPTETQALDLVSYFHTQINPQSQHKATGKELRQAQDLLDQYGGEISRQIINYSVKQAQETNFKMQFFGAALNYIPQAIDHIKKEEERQKRDQAEKRVQEKNEEQGRRYKEYLRQETERYINSIPEEQYKAELEEVKQNLLKQRPWIKATHWDGLVMQSTLEADYKNWLVGHGKIKVLKFEQWKKDIQELLKICKRGHGF